ncbi:MAG: hypothetical protein LBO04_06200 [Spirochaetaceae bacterium]|jgi:hypothetical protein|nr:hypothetical protein [Spirochaetaceae bacterium]
MDVNIYTVCQDAQGTITDEGIGNIFPVSRGSGVDPYSFYATRFSSVLITGAGSTTVQNTHEVKIVMPFGGVNGGFFRFPQVGDQVLVGRLGDTVLTADTFNLPDGDFVLMGYIPDGDPEKWFFPNTAQNCTDDEANAPGFKAAQKNPGSMEDFRNRYGMALRYNSWKDKSPELNNVRFTGLSQTNGGGQTTTSLTLTFDGIVTGLRAEHITVAQAVGSYAVISKGSLSGTGPSYNLAVTVTGAGYIVVTVRVPGYSISGGPKAVFVYHNGVLPGTAPDITQATTAVYKQDVSKQTEISFYRKKAKWPNKTPKERTDSSGNPDTGPLEFDPQDTINIQSAGDIETRADNYQLLKAKRLEILVNTNELSPELRCNNANDSVDWKSGLAPVGDTPLDDPMVHGGDMHIRAGRNIILKANNEIKIQVGRTTVTINDGGLSISTRKTNSNVGLSFDTLFSMTPRDGIAMSGQNVSIAGVNGFSLTDSWGSALAGTLGGLNITGRFIKQSNISSASATLLSFANAVDTAQSIAEGSAVYQDPSAAEAFAMSVWYFNICKTIVKDIGAIALYAGKAWYDHKNAQAPAIQVGGAAAAAPAPAPAGGGAAPAGGGAAAAGAAAAAPAPAAALSATELLGAYEPVELLLLCLNLTLQMTATVYAAIEMDWYIEWQEDTQQASMGGTPKFDAAAKAKSRDLLNIIAMGVDAGLINMAMTIVNSLFLAKGIPGAEADFRIRPSGDIAIKSANYINMYGTEKRTNATTASITSTALKRFADITTMLVKLGTDSAKLAASYGLTVEHAATAYSGGGILERVIPRVEKL